MHKTSPLTQDYGFLVCKLDAALKHSVQTYRPTDLQPKFLLGNPVWGIYTAFLKIISHSLKEKWVRKLQIHPLYFILLWHYLSWVRDVYSCLFRVTLLPWYSFSAAQFNHMYARAVLILINPGDERGHIALCNHRSSYISFENSRFRNPMTFLTYCVTQDWSITSSHISKQSSIAWWDPTSLSDSTISFNKFTQIMWWWDVHLSNSK